MQQLVMDTENPVCTPNPGGQSQFADDWDNFIVALQGGWFSGKSFIGARKLVTLHEHNAFDLSGDPTFVASLVVAPTYPNAMDFCVPHIEDALDEIGLSYVWRSSGPLPGGRFNSPAIILPDLGTKDNPSVIIIRSADAPERITGFTVGAAWGDEPPRWKADRFIPLRNAWLQMTGRVRDTRANFLQIMLTYTNEGDATVVYEEMHAGKPGRALYTAPTRENPEALEFAERQKDILTEEQAEQYLEGGAASLRGGKVYSSFNPTLNIDDSLKLDPMRPPHLSLDFNIAPGMHALVGQHIEESDLFIVVYEIYEPRLDVRGVCGMVKALFDKLEWPWKNENLKDTAILHVFGDATGQSEWAGIGQSCYDILMQGLQRYEIPFRIRVPATNPLVIDRTNAMNVAMCDLSGTVHYKVHPRCVRLIEDFNKMRRDEYGEIDKVDKKLSHASSAEGYRVSYIRPARVSIHRVETGAPIIFGS